MPPIDAELFRETLLEEFRSAWQTLRESHPTEHFYCFGLYTTGAAAEALPLLPRSHQLRESVGDPYDEEAIELVFETAVDVLQ